MVGYTSDPNFQPLGFIASKNVLGPTGYMMALFADADYPADGIITKKVMLQYAKKFIEDQPDIMFITPTGPSRLSMQKLTAPLNAQQGKKVNKMVDLIQKQIRVTRDYMNKNGPTQSKTRRTLGEAKLVVI